MTEKLKELRNKCTTKQAKFVELHQQGQSRAEAYVNAGYQAKTVKIAQQAACKLLTINSKTMAYLSALKDMDSRKTSITRSMQLNRLDTLYNMAIEQKNVTAGASVIREQNEMLGYHREHAPNMEKEQARKAVLEQEIEELERLARIRTAELSEGPKVVKAAFGINPAS